MIESQRKDKINQNLVLENRKKLDVSGVEDVSSFDEKQITALTTMGILTIKGVNLHIKKFNNQTNELNITGRVDELIYSNKQKRNNLNFLGKIFK